MRRFRIVYGVLICCIAGFSQTPVKPVVNFPATGAAAAQSQFIQGIVALHNAGYDDAADYFRAAERIDPNFVMAYWGEAMTYNHPFWAEQNISGGRAALTKLGPGRAARSAKAKTPRERDYLDAVEALYGDGDKDARDAKFADAMRNITTRYPDDVEAAAFYAAALLGTLRVTDHSYKIQTAAAAVLKPILQKYPDHPGALHYFIHANDDPEHARLALDAARRYERIAGGSFHALHMPSHIYVQLGMWADVVRMNQSAFDLSDRNMRARGLSVEFRDYHSLEWLMYGELQMGQYGKARDHAEVILHAAQQPNVNQGMGGFAAIFASRFAVETEQWDVLAPYPEGTRTAELLFAQGMAAVRKNDAGRAKGILDRLEAVSRMHRSNNMRIKAAVADSLRNELSAAVALADKRFTDAERLASESVKYEATMEFPSGPPDVVKPAYEFYGETLLALSKPAQAAEQFRIALKRMPKRALSLLGLARALAAQKDTAGAAKTYRELAEIWSAADATIPVVREVRSFAH